MPPEGRVWETDPALAKQSDLTAGFASAWRAADKVVYSTTLTAVSTATTRLERDFDPDAVQELKAAASSDLTIGGANLAAQAPGGRPGRRMPAVRLAHDRRRRQTGLPAGIRTNLELLDEHRFGNGVVHLRYRVPT